MAEGAQGSKSPTTQITSFLRRFRTEIIAEWKVVARAIPVASQLPTSTFLDHIPDLLDQLGELADLVERDELSPTTFETAQRHAVSRLGAGFAISAVVAELSLLRGCIITIWGRENPDGSISELRALNIALDRAIEASVSKYAEARERTLAGIDRISTASLESSDLETLLTRLLKVFVETTPAADVAVLFLTDGDHLRVRGASGFHEDISGFSLAIGEGFAGRIAAERQALVVRDAYLDPLIQHDVLRDKKVHALFGVPLLQGDELLGVAYMGSVTANEFADEDRQCFTSTATRATIGIKHHLLRQDMAASERMHRQIASERERALAKLESLLAASPVGIAFLDRTFRYLRINESLAAINGKPIEKHIGRTVTEVLGDVAGVLIPVLTGVVDSGRPVTIPFDHPDGRSMLATYFPVRNLAGETTGVGGLVFDVTDAKRAHDELRLQKTRLQSIIEHAPAAIWVKDAEGHILTLNHRLAEALGHPYEQVLGHTSDEILPPDVAAQHNAHDDLVMRENRSIEVEEMIPTPDGVRTYLAIKFPIPTDPPLVGGIATEITERKRMEDELRTAVKTREEILAVVSHDLRGPLATVQLSASVLQGQPSPDQRARRHLEMIHRASKRMEALIDDLLDTANIRAGRLRLDVNREVIADVVTEALDLQQPLAAEQGITLRRSVDLAGIELECDRDRLLQVFGNLIGNALKFCRSGDTISVSGERIGNEVQFCVGDTGPGIALEVQSYLFDAYRSGPDHTKRGSGLGLYICRGVIEGHGGRIWVQSNPGDGARFYFTLPIAG